MTHNSVLGRLGLETGPEMVDLGGDRENRVCGGKRSANVKPASDFLNNGCNMHLP